MVTKSSTLAPMEMPTTAMSAILSTAPLPSTCTPSSLWLARSAITLVMKLEASG